MRGLTLIIRCRVSLESDRGGKEYRLYSDGGLTAEESGKFYRPLEERQKQLDDELPRLQAEVDKAAASGDHDKPRFHIPIALPYGIGSASRTSSQPAVRLSYREYSR